MTVLRSLRPLLIASLLVLAIQPAQAHLLATAYPAAFTLIAEPAPGGDPLLELCAEAQNRLLVETYAINDPPVIAALAAARQRGVDVRVMADPHSASSGPVLAQLAARSVWGRRGNPAYLLTGETAVVIDSTTLALSNAPLTLKARTTQRRFLVVDHDQLDVQQAASIFYDDWERRTPNRFGHQTVLAPPDYQTDLIAAINSASRTLDVVAETVTSPALLTALNTASLRQVKVRALLDPGAPPSVLQALVDAGIHPRLLTLGFTGSALSVDGSRLLIGSAALSDTSLQQQRELGLLLADAGVSGAFSQAFEADWAGATRIAIAAPTPTFVPTFTLPPPKPTIFESNTIPTPFVFTSTPTRRPTATLSPTPIPPTHIPFTPTPPLTATPSVLTVVPVYSSSVRIGGSQQIVVRTIPGAAVTITVTYPDGSSNNRGTTQGVADATGSFPDAWTIEPNVQPGLATARITVTGIGQSKTVTVHFTITL